MKELDIVMDKIFALDIVLALGEDYVGSLESQEELIAMHRGVSGEEYVVPSLIHILMILDWY
jgi:hypothetical protein